MGLFMVTVLPAGASAALAGFSADAACGWVAAGAIVAMGCACMGAAMTWFTAGSSFCLIVNLNPFSSMLTSPMFDLLIILINSWICLKSIKNEFTVLFGRLK